jgi:hypothetical protein
MSWVETNPMKRPEGCPPPGLLLVLTNTTSRMRDVPARDGAEPARPVLDALPDALKTPAALVDLLALGRRARAHAPGQASTFKGRCRKRARRWACCGRTRRPGSGRGRHLKGGWTSPKSARWSRGGRRTGQCAAALRRTASARCWRRRA